MCIIDIFISIFFSSEWICFIVRMIITQLMPKHVATIFNFHIATNKEFYDLLLK